jgi:hypothetical protein
MIPSARVRLALACACVALGVGCGGSKPADTEAPPATTAPAAAGAAAAGSSMVADGDFGVPECDSYMKKYLGCIESKVPEAARATMKQALDQSKAAWKAAASTPQGKAGLVQACTQAEAAAKAATAAYGCQW